MSNQGEPLLAIVERLRGDIRQLLGQLGEELAQERRIISTCTSDRNSLEEIVCQLRGELAERTRDCERLNEMLRRHNYGQGSIDTFVSQCEDQNQQRDLLHAAMTLLISGVECAKLGAPLRHDWEEAAQALLNTWMEQTNEQVAEIGQGSEDHGR